MEKKEALFKAAAGLFARNGFEATTTVQIARAAKATEPMIYYHFSLHFQFVRDMPDETYLIASTCPARLNDTMSICKKIVDTQRFWLTDYLTTHIQKGVRGAEFQIVSVSPTISIIIALLNGLMRQRSLGLEKIEGLKEETIAFCKRSLVKKEARNRRKP